VSAFGRADASVGPVHIILRLVVAFAVALLTLPVFLTSSAFAEGEDAPPPPSSTSEEDAPPQSEPSGEAEPEGDGAGSDPAPSPEPPAEEPSEEPPAEEPSEEPPAEEPAAEEPEAPSVDAPAVKPTTNVSAGKGLAAGADQLAALLVTDPIDCVAQTGTNLNTGDVDGFSQNTQEDAGGSWINGALNQNNSNYAEGDFVPQRVELDDIQPGLNQLVLTFDMTKSTKWAYDFLANLAIDEPGATISWDAPDGPAPETLPSYDNADGTATVVVTVTFDVPEGTDGEMIIRFDAHIASELDYGPDTGAGSISGAPYHVSLSTLNCASAGSQDNQLMSDAVDSGVITITKDAVPNDAQDFNFEIVPGGAASNFFLDDDADGTLPNSVSFNVAPGVYDASEINIPAGWDLVAINCVDADGNSSSTALPTATITVVDNGSTNCTFVNGETSDLVVDKEWVVNGTTYDDGDVPAGFGLNGSATLTLDGSNAVFGASNGGYLAGDQVAINETVDTSGWNDLCSPTSSSVTEFNGATIDEALPYDATVVADDNHATITNVVDCRSHWLLDKSVELLATPGDDDSLAEPGEHLTYTLTVTNDSGFDITGPFEVTDDLSDVLDNATMVDTPAELAAKGLSLVGTDLTWTITGTIADGDSVSVSYTVEINAGAWDQVLHNIATPGDGGECIPPAEALECETTTETPPVTTMVIEKQDQETGEVLAGATFALYEDNAPDDVDAIGPEDVLLDTGVTDASGQVEFDELQPGEYLVEETAPPAGYELPANPVMQVTIDDGNFVPGGEMVPIVFLDPTTGQIAIVAKQQFEFIDGEWVLSDGVVDFGDFVKYVVSVEATGPKNFYNVEVSDYIPGFNPVDTTSTTQATLVEDSPACTGDLSCTITVGPDGLVTFDAGDLFPGNGDTIGGAIEFVIQFPQAPDEPVFVDGLYTDFLWNEGYLDYDEVVGGTPDVNERAAKAKELIFEHHSLTSNEVVVSAELEEEPIEPTPPPPDLPDTGAQAHLGQLALLGGMLLTFGVALVARRRKEAHQPA
jgi:uncharacterized repeat protein (TIGR01451 family)/LPXTG-motif cell wall-anchored protein